MARRHYGKIPKVRKSARVEAPALVSVTPSSRDAARPIPMRQEQKGAKLTTYETQTIQHGDILASSRGGSSYYAPGRGCVTKEGGGPRRGQIDLVFVPRNVPAGKHSKRPPPPGPALRFCGPKKGFAPMVPVKDPREAKKIAKAYQTCLRQDPQKTPETCFEEVTGGKVTDAPFGEKISRRRSPASPRASSPRASTAKSTFVFPWQRRR